MDILNQIRHDLGYRICRSGAALYSSARTLKPGKYLIVGLNPGGADDQNFHTIDSSLTACLDYNYNAYLNEEWGRFGKGKHPIQKSLKVLFDSLGEDLNDVCATNLIYERTKAENDLDTKHLIFYEPFLTKIMNVVQPKIIIVFGGKPYLSLKNRLSKIDSEISESSGHGNWMIFFLRGLFESRAVLIVGLPHLSRYSLSTRGPQIDLIKNACT